jgi:hypothetical protein
LHFNHLGKLGVIRMSAASLVKHQWVSYLGMGNEKIKVSIAKGFDGLSQTISVRRMYFEPSHEIRHLYFMILKNTEVDKTINDITMSLKKYLLA